MKNFEQLDKNIVDGLTGKYNLSEENRFKTLHTAFDLCEILGLAARRNEMSVAEFLEINIFDYKKRRMF